MTPNQKKFLLFAGIFTLIAIGLHLYLNAKYLDLHFGGASSPSICNINPVLNCDAVSASSYSALFGVPMALWGAITNAAVLFFAIIAFLGFASRPERAHRFALYGSFFVALASIIMGLISVLFVSAVCLFCIFCYVLSFASAIFLWLSLAPPRFSKLGEDLASLMGEDKWISGVLLVVPAAAFFINAMALDKREIKNEIIMEKISLWKQSKEFTFLEDQGLVYHKGSSAKVKIVEFADFLCPHCKHAYPSLHAFADAHPDVKLVYKFFPLDGACNADTNMSPGDGKRCTLAYATYCAEKNEKKGWQVHHKIFDEQENIYRLGDKDQLIKWICQENKLDCAPLKTCMESEETRNQILAMTREGIAAEVKGTPAVYVNGKPLMGGQLLPILTRAYNDGQ